MTNPELEQIILLSLKQVADAVGRSPDTINEWVRREIFPPPIQALPGGKKQWTVATIKAWVEKRRRARYVKPAPRGRLRRGSQKSHGEC